MGSISDKLRGLVDRGVGEAKDNQAILVGVAGGAALLGAWSIYSSGSRRSKPSSFELSGGSIAPAKLKKEFTDYTASYGENAGEGIKQEHRINTAELVNTFYNLVTDFYEWGWGTSFHFSPQLPGKTQAASEAAHEARLPGILGLKPGTKALDVGCGVGGPMRTIASTSGSHVTGITINDYQVQRAKYHNERLGLAGLCEPVEGNFLRMPFEEGSFDGAYAIEATCHAPKLEDVYGEIYRILKPGALFASYEWVATAKFDPNNAEHVRIMDDINYGNGLPEMRTFLEAEAAGKAVGFELIDSRDIAHTSPPAGHWYLRLKWLAGFQIHINAAIVHTLAFFRLVPRGTQDVHDMLVHVARSLVRGGETGIFSPMHLLVFRKPLTDK